MKSSRENASSRGAGLSNTVPCGSIPMLIDEPVEHQGQAVAAVPASRSDRARSAPSGFILPADAAARCTGPPWARGSWPMRPTTSSRSTIKSSWPSRRPPPFVSRLARWRLASTLIELPSTTKPSPPSLLDSMGRTPYIYTHLPRIVTPKGVARPQYGGPWGSLPVWDGWPDAGKGR